MLYTRPPAGQFVSFFARPSVRAAKPSIDQPTVSPDVHGSMLFSRSLIKRSFLRATGPARFLEGRWATKRPC